jgi:hypothetical protein
MKFVRTTSVASLALFCLVVLQVQLTGQGRQVSVASWINNKNETVDLTQASAKLSPPNVNFGYVAFDTRSSPQTVTLTNTGTSRLRITQIAITGADLKDFAQTHTCGNYLKVGGSCLIHVTFEPRALGARAATLSVTDNGSDSPQTVSLSGIGVAGKCTPEGEECPPQFPPCCPGLVCAPASDRAFCVPG